MWPFLLSVYLALSGKPVRNAAICRRPAFRRPLLEALEDRTLLSTYVVTTTADSGAGSLRQAILDANAAATGTAGNPDLIQFNLPTTDPGYNGTTGAFTIQPLSALPTVTDTVVLDSYTQPGASPNTLAIGDNAVLNIVLDGSLAGAVDGLVIGGGNTTVRGLVIDNFASGSGLVLNGSGADVITGNFIGTDVSGEAAAANVNGVSINTASGDTIGGASPGDRNIISGNGNNQNRGFGIVGGSGDLIQGNYVGTDKSGTSAVANFFGIAHTTNSTIGGLTAAPGTGAGNVVSGNVNLGIWVEGAGESQNLVAGNLVGTYATGLGALSNGGGIALSSNNNTVGGTTAGARNIISGNANGNGTGIGIDGGQNNLVEGNYIGTDITGPTTLGGQAVGIMCNYPSNTIGGSTAAARNVISGNSDSGIQVNRSVAPSSSSNQSFLIEGNYIGTDARGTVAVPNAYGIKLFVGASDAIIGGALPSEGNLITGNGIGVFLNGSPTDPSTGNLIQGNLIGTEKTGTVPLGNAPSGYGVYIRSANNNMIGGTAPGAGNTFAFHSGNGVYVESGTGNSILGNSIFSNGSPGILLDGANNANDNQAAPVLTGVRGSAASPSIGGSLTSVPNTTFRIEFFASPSPSNAANTEGQTLLGFTYVTTDGSGYAPTSASGLSPISSGQNYLTATATVATPNGGGTYTYGDTSQFTAYLHVSYFFSGFLPPLDSNLSFGLNRTIPIKFQLTDFSGSFVTSLGAVTSLQVLNGQGTDVMAEAGTTGLRVAGHQFIYNWSTKGLPAGTYTITLILADGTSYTKVVQLVASGRAAAQVAAESGGSDSGSTVGGLLAGDIELYVSDPSGLLTADEQARIQDAINAVDQLVSPYGAGILETTDSTQADVVLDTGSTSAVGGYTDGILACYSPTGEITLLQGWNWYAGADPTQVGTGQYDFETVVLHELGHALGLGEGSNPASAMYGTLTAGTAVRTITTPDLNIPYGETGADGDHAAVSSTAALGAEPPRLRRERRMPRCRQPPWRPTRRGLSLALPSMP
jgi:hypothetical protein